MALAACGWLKPAAGSGDVHVHGPGCNHGPEGHAHHDNDHRMYGGWDTTAYPSAANLYRAMHLIDALKDTSDKGAPSHTDMFVATFSEEYIRYKPDSTDIQALKLLLVQHKLNVHFSGAAWDESTKQYLPRLARVLDLVRFDSTGLHYRARSLNGNWIHEGNKLAQWSVDTLYPSVQFEWIGKEQFIRMGELLLRPERYLLEAIRP